MSDHLHHDNLIQSIVEEHSELFSNSQQGIYIYLDDTHKACNKNFSNLLGYESEDEWAQIEASFPDTFVADKSQEKLISAFQDAVESLNASVNTIEWKKKDGSTVTSEVILVPVVRGGHVFALHFVTNL